MKLRITLPLIFLLLSAFSADLSAQDWPRFRGPDALGAAPSCKPPVTWSDTENIAWKTPLPGAGVSSPIVVGDRIFLTCYTNVDRWDEQQRSDRKGMKQAVVCISTSGQLLWTREYEAAEQTHKRVVRWHGYASNTPVSDGKMVYAYFGTTGMVALTVDGKKMWHFRDVGDRTPSFGTAASPVLVDDRVIIPAQAESRQLIFLDKITGEERMRIKDNGEMWDGFRMGYSTPVIAEVNGQKQLVIGIMNGVAGYDPGSGEQLWVYYYFERGKGHSYPCTSPVVVDGIVYFSVANSHRANDTMAIDLSAAKGEIKQGDPSLLWHNNQAGSYVGSVVYHDGNLYLNHFGNNSPRSKQGFFCLDAKTGQTLYWAKRVGGPKMPDPKLIYASGLLVKDRIIVPSVSDGIFVIAAKPEFELVAHNTFADDDTAFSASPVPLGDDRVLLRSDKYLYCIGE
jgi:outer membrane protein assembly factor BamB